MNDRDFWMGYMMGSSEGESGVSGGDGSGIIAILGVIGGLVLEAMFLMLLGVEVSEVPVFLLCIGWVVGTCVTTVVIMLLFKGSKQKRKE